jgi:hypothetical protein
MATQVQTPAPTTKPVAPKVEKVKKAPVPVAQRITEQLKRGALGGKLSGADLDKLAALAGSLKVFVETK